MKDKVSIIMVCYDQLMSARHVSMASVANITRFTDPEDYELIIVDVCPKYPFRDDYKVLKIDKMITLNPDPGYFASMNIGAKKAKGKYLCFIENDIFVYEGWLKQLKAYLDSDTLDAVFPDQIPCTRKQQLSYYNLDPKDAIGKGAHEQGLVLIKKESFDKIGGWDKKLKAGYGWKRFYQQLSEHGLHCNNTAKVTVTHITGMTYYNTLEFNSKKFNKIAHKEGKYLNG